VSRRDACYAGRIPANERFLHPAPSPSKQSAGRPFFPRWCWPRRASVRAWYPLFCDGVLRLFDSIADDSDDEAEARSQEREAADGAENSDRRGPPAVIAARRSVEREGRECVPPRSSAGAFLDRFKSQSKCRTKISASAIRKKKLRSTSRKTRCPLSKRSFTYQVRISATRHSAMETMTSCPPPSDARGQYEEPHDQQCPPGRVDVIEVEPGLSVIPPPRRPPRRRRIKRSVQNGLKPAKSPVDEPNNLVL
jgi:hypothetical protein